MAAIITGSDSGIGKATAVALARRGHDVGITYSRDEDGANATAKEVRSHGRRAEVRHLDLTQTVDVQPTIEALADALGQPDVLVNNSGTGTSTPFLEIALDEWRDVLEVDLTGAFLAAQAAARRMVASGTPGRIVNVTSVHEHVPLEGATPYVAAKHGLGGLTKSMALELAEHGITVNSVAPGEIATPMTGQEDHDPHGKERPGVPLRRPGDAREVAELIAFLASPEASYTTGASPRWDWVQARDLCFREVRHVTRDSGLAEDAAQEAPLRAWRARASCRTPEAPGPWLVAIARNVAPGALTRQRRQPFSVPLEGSRLREADPKAQDVMAQALERVIFGDLLRLLTAPERRLLRLRYEDDLTHPEIARRLGLPEGTVKVRLHRLRARLHEELSR